METESTETMNLSINETHNNSNSLSVYKVPVALHPEILACKWGSIAKLFFKGG